jgi:hypothetical protein
MTVDTIKSKTDARAHPGHARHRAHAHHWAATILAGLVALFLITLLLVGHQQLRSGPTFKAPRQALATEAAITAGALKADFDQITISELGDGALAN